MSSQKDQVTQSRGGEGTFVPASVVLQTLRDQAPAGQVTLEWLTDSLNQKSFGMIILILALIAVTPGISPLGGLLLWAPAFQMMLDHPKPWFPRWIATRNIPTRRLGAVVSRAIPILVLLERAIYPRFHTAPKMTKRIVGTVILMLTARLVLMPIPMSNILPAVLIALISLAYLEQDGLVLIVTLLAGSLVLALDFALAWQLAHDANWTRLLF
jgi:hypothetical protein